MDSLDNLKLAVLVPHQDDELNIAGQILPYFIDEGAQVKICYSTNGDMRVYEGAPRYREAVKAAAVMGLAEEDLVWLGYPDCKMSAHLYHNRFLDEEHPERMKTKCYGPKQTLTMELTGEEKPVCRASLLADLCLFLRSYKPDVVISIDLDSHPDHRALSLLTEEAVSIVVREDEGYRPYLLKKFAYAGCWYGPDDYYSFSETRNEGDGCCGDVRTCNPSLSWDDRIRYAVHPRTLTFRLRDNIVYRAAKAYKTQVPWPNMARVCNLDAVYWPERTDNLLYRAHVEATSGGIEGLYDLRNFDLADLAAPLEGSNIIPVGWSPEPDDALSELRISFEKPEVIRIAEFVPSVCNESSVSLKVYTDQNDWTFEMVRPGERVSIELPEGATTGGVRLCVESDSETSRCIASVGLYGHEAEVLPIPVVNSHCCKSKTRQSESKYRRIARKAYFHLLKKTKLVRRSLRFNRRD